MVYWILNPMSTRETTLGIESAERFPSGTTGWVWWVWGWVLWRDLMSLSHLMKWQRWFLLLFFWEAAAVWLQPILEEDSVRSCLLGIPEKQGNNFINGLILNVNVFIATSQDYILIINTPTMLATGILGQSLPPVIPFFLMHLTQWNGFWRVPVPVHLQSSLARWYTDRGTEMLSFPPRSSRMVTLAFSRSRLYY